ncbi:hypothetical protein CH381_02390 [Leptospira sp. mixed culture ATI2-C-A1]|nr:hypothetical protein CH381_02390 [Leptospira sp. mixed culture ATI2-C-A1]
MSCASLRLDGMAISWFGVTTTSLITPSRSSMAGTMGSFTRTTGLSHSLANKDPWEKRTKTRAQKNGMFFCNFCANFFVISKKTM